MVPMVHLITIGDPWYHLNGTNGAIKWPGSPSKARGTIGENGHNASMAIQWQQWLLTFLLNDCHHWLPMDRQSITIVTIKLPLSPLATRAQMVPMARIQIVMTLLLPLAPMDCH